MSKKIDFENLSLDFLSDDDDVEIEEKAQTTYKIIIADDDHEVHAITKMILKDFSFEGSKLEFYSAYSGREAKDLIREHADTAIIFLDVVMESHNSGLDVVSYMRDNLKNTMTRIVLRTGQPGEAPEEDVIKNYDINDYRLKTELTVKRLHTTLYTALRNFRDLRELQQHKKGLERIIKASSELFSHASLHDFLSSVLNELSNFYNEPKGMIYLRNLAKNPDGFITIDHHDQTVVVAATGKYQEYVGKKVAEVEALKFIKPYIADDDIRNNEVNQIEDGFIVKNRGKSMINNYVYIEGSHKVYDFDLINLFLINYSSALDNYLLSNILSTARKDIIQAVIAAVENHYSEPNSHIKRTSDMLYRFALKLGYREDKAEALRVSSSLHDIGKLEIPKTILRKTEPLTPEEIQVIKYHTEKGFDILDHSDLDILRVAALIALTHHEKYDGTGYPKGLKSTEIPEEARMLAIVDVFDAMTHERSYGKVNSSQDALDYIQNNKDKHFDGRLVDIFLNNFDDIVAPDND